MKKITLMLVLLMVFITGCQGLDNSDVINIDVELPKAEEPEMMVEEEKPPGDSAMDLETEEAVEEDPYTYIEGITLTKLDGTEVQIEDYRGKYVILNIWASW